MTTHLTDLLRRVEGANKCDSRLDAEIACALIFKDLRPAEKSDHREHMRPGDYENVDGYIWTKTGFLLADNYTGSVDSALALVERALPGWHWTTSSPFLDPGAMFYAALVNPEGTGGPEPWEVDHEMHEAQAKSAPLAILAALLKALIVREAA